MYRSYDEGERSYYEKKAEGIYGLRNNRYCEEVKVASLTKRDNGEPFVVIAFRVKKNSYIFFSWSSVNSYVNLFRNADCPDL